MAEPPGPPGEGGRELTVRRVFDAPRELVWRAFTEPEQFARWFGHPPYRTPPETVTMDVRPGGRWDATQVHTKTGSELPFAGIYREVVPPERLVFEMIDPDEPENPRVEVVTVTLAEVEGGTEVVLHQAGYMPPEQYELTEKGWGKFFDGLVELLAERRGPAR